MIKPKKEPKIIKPNIKPDAPGTQPGDVGNGHVLVVDTRTQRFNGLNYHLQQSGIYSREKKCRETDLHFNVWVYHNGEVPEDYVIHHDKRNPDGTFDKNENNIEYLLLMTRGDHTVYHMLHRVPSEHVCEQCGKKFETIFSSQKYCDEECRRRHDTENRLITRICPVCKKHFRVRYGDPTPVCSEECDAILKSMAVPVVYEHCVELPQIKPERYDGRMTTRVCPICNRSFRTCERKLQITCSFECGVIVARITHARRRVMEEKFNWDGKFLNLINKVLGVKIRGMLIKGKPWFAAKDVCDALDIKNSRDAVARLDDDEKQSINVATNTVGLNDGNPSYGKRGNPNMTFVNEFGLYRLILESRKPEAKKFKRWITHNVLPSLREYGFYVMEEDSLLLELEDTEKTFMHKLLAACREGNSSAAHKLVDEMFGRADTPMLEAPRAETAT